MAAEPVRTTTSRFPPVGEVGVSPARLYETSPLHWGSIVGGYLIGLTIFALLGLLGIATGLSAFNAGSAAATGTAPATEAGINSALWAGISGIISYLIGGFAAARIVNCATRSRGMANGAMVFLLSVPVTMLVATQGMSGLLSGLGGLAAGAATMAPGNVAPPSSVGGTVSPTEVARAAEGVRNAAWASLIVMIVALVASAIGGYLGANPTVEVERTR
ncbi:MAG TPA: hypothetical protein VFC51_08960 [Chloroflexota bacterium]|nr:hypothetical protein [Chloroflexota bacterium]